VKCDWLCAAKQLLFKFTVAVASALVAAGMVAAVIRTVARRHFIFDNLLGWARERMHFHRFLQSLQQEIGIT
jgi:hypothetical protein